MADRLVREGMAGYAHEVLDSMIAPATVRGMPDVAGHVLAMMLGTAPQGAAAALRGRAGRPDYTELLGAITVPVLVVVGDGDVFTPLSDARYMYERLPDARLAVIEGAGHMPNLERPEAFNRELAALLAEVDARQAPRAAPDAEDRRI
jgi:pimeloyl-ACP methyl ester carboxylesterase